MSRLCYYIASPFPIMLMILVHLVQGALLIFEGPSADHHIQFQFIPISEHLLGLAMVISAWLGCVGMAVRSGNRLLAALLLCPEQYLSAATFLSRTYTIMCACGLHGGFHPSSVFIAVDAFPGMAMSLGFTLSLAMLALREGRLNGR